MKTVRFVVIAVATLGVVIMLGSMGYFYLIASKQIIYFEPAAATHQKFHFLITAGSRERIRERLEIVAPIASRYQASATQLNLKECRHIGDLLSAIPKKLKIECNSIHGEFGTTWEIQSALVMVTKQEEILVVPLIPEQALKIMLISGDKKRIRIILLPASFFRRLTEFGKSWLGWILPDFVHQYRKRYYDYDLWL